MTTTKINKATIWFVDRSWHSFCCIDDSIFSISNCILSLLFIKIFFLHKYNFSYIHQTDALYTQMYQDSMHNILCPDDSSLIFYTHINTIVIHFWFEIHFLPTVWHLQLYDICFANVFTSFIPDIILNTAAFTSFVLFGPHILAHGLPRVWQLSLHLWRPIING